MRPATLRELCARNGTPLPALGGVLGTFAAFQELYDAARTALTTADDLSRLVREIVGDAEADGAVWVEIGVNVWEHGRLGSPAALLELLIAAGEEVVSGAGVGVGWMVTADRTASPELAVEQAQLAAAYAGKGVVAFGLANDEAAAPPELFADAFSIVRAAGLLSTPHAGEHRGPDSVLGALESLGADRIQHGVRAAEDAHLVERLSRESVCLDVCPTSNVCLSVVPEMGAHPLLDFLRAGVPCSINADDPLLFSTTLLDEYELCRHQLGCSDDLLAACARASVDHSGAPDALKSAPTRPSTDGWPADETGVGRPPLTDVPSSPTMTIRAAGHDDIGLLREIERGSEAGTGRRRDRPGLRAHRPGARWRPTGPAAPAFGAATMPTLLAADHLADTTALDLLAQAPWT